MGTNLVGGAARVFDRSQESAADRVAAELVYAEYGHVAGAWRFLERQASKDTQLDAFAVYFRTHPMSAARVEALSALATERGWSTTGELAPLARP